jgi:hypothetical protein
MILTVMLSNQKLSGDGGKALHATTIAIKDCPALTRTSPEWAST